MTFVHRCTVSLSAEKGAFKCKALLLLLVPVAHLVGDGERHREARVLVDVAAAVRLAHPGQVRQAQGLTRLVHPGTDVLPGVQASTQPPR